MWSMVHIHIIIIIIIIFIFIFILVVIIMVMRIFTMIIIIIVIVMIDHQLNIQLDTGLVFIYGLDIANTQILGSSFVKA